MKKLYYCGLNIIQLKELSIIFDTTGKHTIDLRSYWLLLIGIVITTRYLPRDIAVAAFRMATGHGN